MYNFVLSKSAEAFLILLISTREQCIVYKSTRVNFKGGMKNNHR